MSIRPIRVAKVLQREIADLLQTDFQDQLQPMVTVTGVRVTKDLSIAYVYVSVMGEALAQRQAAHKRLEEINTQIRTALARRIRHQVRVVPQLRFFLDETLNEAKKMDALFDKIRAERSGREGTSAETDES